MFNTIIGHYMKNNMHLRKVPWQHDVFLWRLLAASRPCTSKWCPHSVRGCCPRLRRGSRCQQADVPQSWGSSAAECAGSHAQLCWGPSPQDWTMDPLPQPTQDEWCLPGDREGWIVGDDFWLKYVFSLYSTKIITIQNQKEHVTNQLTNHTKNQPPPTIPFGPLVANHTNFFKQKP